MIRSVLAAALGALLKLLLGRWLTPKEVPHEAYEAKVREAEIMAAPARPKRSVVDELRRQQSDD